jgi:hypothetical protein
VQFTDRLSPKVGLSAPGPWLTVELVVGGYGLGFGWGLFLWVPESV